MAGSIKGLLVEIGGDTSGLQKALKKVNSESSSLSKELKGINSLLKLDPKNTELLAQKQTILTSNIKETEEKLKLLKQAQKEADETIKNGGEISQENYRNLQREIISTENKLKNLNKEYKNFLTETSKLTQAGKAMQELGEKVEKGSKKISELGSNITSKATTGVIGLGTVAITTAASLEEATDKYIAKAGKSVEETEKYKKVLTDINDANFGEGYEDIANSMAIVEQQMRGLDDAADLENITKKAYYLKDAFDAEVNESVRAAKMMMEQWGISADEAFELINQGYQKGLDKNGDFLDSINEYSVHFRQIGLTATDMFNTFKQGADSGAFSIDKVGDAIKEMGIRLKDGSVTDTLKSMKLNAKDLEKAFAEGGERGSWAFGEIVKGLQNIKDPLKQNQAGVAIFGTMWEDLGKDAVFAMSAYGEEFDETMNTMTTSMDKMYNNTKGNTETAIKRIKTISANLGTKLLPIVNKVLDKAEVFIDKLDDLSDSEQDNIIKIGLLVASAGPLIKVIGTAGTIIGKTSKGIGVFSQALSVAKNNSTSTSKSVNNLASVLKKIISPAGLATAAIAAIGIAYAKTKEDIKKEYEFYDDIIDSLRQTAEARQQESKSIKDNMSQKIAEIDNVKALKMELEGLVDENGKVKDSYEARAEFILNELNEALGTESKLVDGQIQDYKKLIGTIDELILKKKAEIIMSSQEEAYANAVKNKKQAIDDLNKALQEQKNIEKEINSKRNQIKDLDYSWDVTAGYQQSKLWGEIKELEEKYKGLGNTIENNRNNIEGYYKDIEDYNTNQALMLQGTTEAYQKIEQNVTQVTSKIASDTTKSMNERINGQLEVLKKSQEYYDMEVKYNKNARNSIEATNLESRQKELNDLAEQLAKETSTIEELTPEQLEAWKTLSKESTEAYAAGIAQLDKTTSEKVQAVTGVLLESKPEIAEVAEMLGGTVVDRFGQNAEADKAAVSTLQGYLRGLSDSQLRSLLEEAGIKNADTVIKELDKENLSLQNGENILRGLYNGLNSNKWKNNILGVATSLATKVNSAFTKVWDIHSPSKFMSKLMEFYLSPIEDKMNERKSKILAVTHQLATNVNREMVNGFNIPDYSGLQNNLANKMMSTTNTKNSYNIELKFYPQKMTETELNNAFKFLNRKLGKLY